MTDSTADKNKSTDIKDTSDSEKTQPTNFVRTIINTDIESERYDKRVHTRFPPEPNGYLHIGHAKSICLNFGIAQSYKDALCNLRFDDTNPTKEESEYVDAIIDDIRWLGFDWGERLCFASDYFDQLYDWAKKLVTDNKAYVDDLTADEIRQYRGTLTQPGQDSPHRNRPADENLDLLERMKNGEFPDGSKVLRAKIDMASPNLNMRDPVMYRVLHAEHHRTGNKWCIYPMYDWAHGQSDSIEGITHSICTLEFEAHRPLYDWFLDNLEIHHPQQIEFAPLGLSYTILSKRKLLQLVVDSHVTGWDDPRMPTIRGMRRRGYTAGSIRNFCERVGVARKQDKTADIALLEHCLREELNLSAPRVMAVLSPLKVIIDNYPDDKVEQIEAINNPEDDTAGTRQLPFSKEIYIERTDFMEDPPKKFFRLAPGSEVRLKHSYYITCTSVIKDETTGEIKELHCTYDPESSGGSTPDGRRVKGTIQWVSSTHAIDAEVRLYDHLFSKENPLNVAEDEEFTANLNPDSLTVLADCKLEPSLKNTKSDDRYQFMRHGYFCADSKDSSSGKLIFNRTVSLRDTWAKIAAGGKKK